MPNPLTLSPKQWRVLLPLGLATLLSLSGDLTLYAVLPTRAQAFGLSLATVGVILSANRFIRLLSNPAAGVLLDRWGRRPAFLTGLGLGTIATLGYLAPQNQWLFLAARLLWGVSWSLIYVGGYSMVVDVTGPADRGRGSGVLQVFYFAGLCLNPLLGGLLTDRLGFQPALATCAGLAALGFLIALLALPETLASRNMAKQPARSRRSMNLRELPGRLARRPQLAATYYLYMLASFAGDGIVMSTLSLHIQSRYGDVIPAAGSAWPVATVGGALLALRALISAGVAPLAGGLSDRGARRWGSIRWGILTGILGMGMVALLRSPYALVLGVALIALSGGILTTVLPALVGDLAAETQRGAAMGGLMVAGDLGCAVAPLATYSALSILPTEGAYLVTALLLATGLVVPRLAAQGTRDGATD